VQALACAERPPQFTSQNSPKDADVSRVSHPYRDTQPFVFFQRHLFKGLIRRQIRDLFA
jgi:hypothetical protein